MSNQKVILVTKCEECSKICRFRSKQDIIPNECPLNDKEEFVWASVLETYTKNIANRQAYDDMMSGKNNLFYIVRMMKNGYRPSVDNINIDFSKPITIQKIRREHSLSQKEEPKENGENYTQSNIANMSDHKTQCGEDLLVSVISILKDMFQMLNYVSNDICKHINETRTVPLDPGYNFYMDSVRDGIMESIVNKIDTLQQMIKR